MSLRESYVSGLHAALEKFAVSGAMYARALQNAASQSGSRLAPKVMAQVAAQPRATASPMLSTQARTPGVLKPSAQQQQLQGIMDKVPWAGSEHGGAPGAAGQFSQTLQQHGMTSSSGGNINKQILERFGPAPGHGLAYTNTKAAPEPTNAGYRKRRAPMATADTMSMRSAG